MLHPPGRPRQAYPPNGCAILGGMSDLVFRTAVRADLPAVVALLADDVLGRGREAAVVDEAYERAFADIEADPRNQLVVGEQDGEVVGCLQITYIPGLGRHGAERSLIEAVRVRSDHRGTGVGRAMVTWAVDQARERGCGLVQLTTDKRRADAQRFYRGLGFVASHEGMKLPL
ncbi:ribosomal protein S18 acetylase RimI-like enzyme [Micromonospora sagamiensis]|uniref:Ribosomal protein S18 acetylase RimI-like enzyme n=2 Tax=Micromonospora sagamiensis TaxID=47875 RepID=A0A562WKV6_9ACTN|nr:ribosomal protein S18 acetylase RimI-like enzyme [Micromonospora sagamiensis]